MYSPACTKARSPRRRSSARTFVCCSKLSALASLRAHTVCFRPRKDADCALLRPSASASAKLANSTVNHSQMVTLPMNQLGASPLPRRACSHRIVVSRLPTYTTNMTGLRHCVRGSSLRTASHAAGASRARSNIERVGRVMAVTSGLSVRPQHQVLDQGSERQCGHEGEDADQ